MLTKDTEMLRSKSRTKIFMVVGERLEGRLHSEALISNRIGGDICSPPKIVLYLRVATTASVSIGMLSSITIARV